MKICQITIHNFRTFEYFNQEVGRHNTLVGQNNSGKSNLLWAISCFYNPIQLYSEDIRKDEHGERVDDNFTICLTFDELNDEEKRENQKYLNDDKIKIELKGFFDENNKFIKEHHGYIKNYKLSFPDGFDEDLSQILISPSSPRVAEIAQIDQLQEIRDALSLQGRYSADHWERIKEEFLNQHSEIQKIPVEILSPDKYHGFIKTSNPDVIGKCIMIPAIKDPQDILHTGKTSTPISQLVTELLSGIESDEILQKFANLQEDLINERKTHKVKLEERFNEELGLWNTKVKIDLKKFEIQDSLPIKFDLFFNDGVLTDLERKGTGLQRYVFFKFLKIFNEIRLKPGISIIFLFEEPEAHLHPQIQREIAIIVRDLAQSEDSPYQTFISTHSPQFIDMRNLDNVFIFKKEENFCTDSTKCQLNLVEIKEKINVSLFFDPHVNEIFFADRVVLLEGQSEQLLFNILIQEGMLNVMNTSIINTQSKFNIPLFVKVLNSLKIPYCVMIDEDPFFLPYYTVSNKEKIKGKRRAYRLNLEIAELIDESLGKLVIVSPDLDVFLGISRNQKSKIGKPTAVYHKFKELRRAGSSKIGEIQDLFEKILNPELLIHIVSKQDGTEWQNVDENSISLATSNFGIFKNAIKQQLKIFKRLFLKITNRELNELKSLFNGS